MTTDVSFVLGGQFAPIIVGASGFIGKRLLALSGPLAVGTYRAQSFLNGIAFDARTDRLAALLRHIDRPFTHAILLFAESNIEKCAADHAGTEFVNVVSMIAAIDDAFACGLVPVYFSTDYVFDGSRGNWSEADEPNPNTAYGRQKAAVEAYLRNQTKPWLIVRLSKVVDDTLNRYNMLGEWIGQIKAGARMKCAFDQTFSPIYVEDSVKAILWLAANGETGLWNIAGTKAFSRLNLLETLVREVRAVAPHVSPRIEQCRLHDLPFREQRPLDTSLSVDQLRRRVPLGQIQMDILCRQLAKTHFTGATPG